MKKLFRNTQKKLITSPTNFPSGLAVKVGAATYWIKDNKRYRLVSERAAESWSFTTIEVEETAISHIKIAGKLGFRDGTLIKNIADGKMYLISQNKRRHIVSPDSFDRYGLDRSKIIEVGDAEVKLHVLGENL